MEMNLSFLIMLLKKELSQYYDTVAQKKEIASKVNLISEASKILTGKDYDEIKNNYLLFEYIFSEELGERNGKKIANEIYSCASYFENYKKNPTNYFPSEYKQKCDRFKKCVNKINDLLQRYEVESISITPSISFEEMVELKRIISNFKFKRIINSNQYDFITKILREKNLSTKDIIFLLESIKVHNTNIHLREKNQKINYYKNKEVTDMLSFGYEEIEYVNCDSGRKTQLDSTISFITSMQDSINTSDLAELLPAYENNLTFSGNYDLNEFCYLMTNLLRFYQNIMINDVKEISEYENYIDKDFRNFVVSDYYVALYKYLFIRKYMFEHMKKYDEDLISLTANDPDIYKLEYASTSSSPDDIYFLSDLKNIPEDFYPRIKSLLIAFKKGLLNNKNTKMLSGIGAGLSEIKHNQLRIVYKHIKDNEYLILGVFQKKENFGKLIYEKSSNRALSPYVSDEEVEKIIFDRLDNQYHKGSKANI